MDQPFRTEPFPDEMDFALMHERGECDSTCDYCADDVEREIAFLSHDDTVKCCPDCERPNQFGELCSNCLRER